MRLVASEGSPLAFAVLYERHVRGALALAMQICPRRVLAEEIVQEAFLSIWRGRRHYDRHRGAVRPWLLWTVRNRAIDVLRQNVPQEATQDEEGSIDELSPARDDSTDQEVGRREHTREVLAVLDALPDEQSLVIALAYYGGYTQAEIASMLDTPLGTIKGRMRLGLRKMADGLLATA
jgi:RNA polymerase sigma-70 factor (ECF subfamily)